MKSPNDILEENNNKSKIKFNESKTIIVIIIVCISFVLFLSAYGIYRAYIPVINEYELVRFTTKKDDNSYIEIQTSNNNDCDTYLKYIFINNNDVMHIKRLNIKYVDIKFKSISYDEQPKITIEETKNIFENYEDEIYIFHLPKEDIEKIKNQMWLNGV